jgi:predicted dithiol-disulfide oxidoreductase (DUF899 family)
MEVVMIKHHIVSHEEWIQARKRFLAKEKAFTHHRDELSRERQALPWERVEKHYVFESEQGKETLADLFGKYNQLIIYHFMFDPDWDLGCKSCSFWADNFDGIIPHLHQRDVSMVAVSRAPLRKLQEQARKLGWKFKWVSSFGSDFNFDYGVSFSADAIEREEAFYNYGTQKVTIESHTKKAATELPGVSAFFKSDGEIYHTYSAYSRGIDTFNAAYQFLDVAPKGRDEGSLSFPMAWVKHRIAYDN